MTMARAHLVNPVVTRWYHCVTRYVRRAFLLGEGPGNRKQWIENRLEELAEVSTVAVGGFSVMDNHLHADDLQGHTCSVCAACRLPGRLHGGQQPPIKVEPVRF